MLFVLGEYICLYIRILGFVFMLYLFMLIFILYPVCIDLYGSLRYSCLLIFMFMLIFIFKPVVYVDIYICLLIFMFMLIFIFVYVNIYICLC